MNVNEETIDGPVGGDEPTASKAFDLEKQKGIAYFPLGLSSIMSMLVIVAGITMHANIVSIPWLREDQPLAPDLFLAFAHAMG
jgi:hypothetical protein